jgi:hypothetical protein
MLNTHKRLGLVQKFISPVVLMIVSICFFSVPVFASGGDSYAWTTSGDGSKGILFVNYTVPFNARGGNWSISTTTSQTLHIDNYTKSQLGDCWTSSILQFAILSDTGQSYWGNTIRCWDGSWHELIRHAGADTTESGSGDGGTPTEAYDDDWETGTTCLSNTFHNGCNWQSYSGSYNAQINEEMMFWEFYSIESSDISTSISSPYDGSLSSFNAIWTTDDDAIDSAWIVGIDISNYTMMIEGNISSYSVILPIGTYDIFMCANTTHGAAACTDTQSYVVKPPPPIEFPFLGLLPILLLLGAGYWSYKRITSEENAAKKWLEVATAFGVALAAIVMVMGMMA